MYQLNDRTLSQGSLAPHYRRRRLRRLGTAAAMKIDAKFDRASARDDLVDLARVKRYVPPGVTYF
jgi:hypothetical protein